MRDLLSYFASSGEMTDTQREWLSSHLFLIGDLHNHCAISYGHGRLGNAISFAGQQLDFFSVTGHFAWPDMRAATCEPAGDATDSLRKPGSPVVPDDVVAYHEEGFSRLSKNWSGYKKAMSDAEKPGTFIPFLSYEYHSFLHGDYTILQKDLDAELPTDTESDPLSTLLDTVDPRRDGMICFPHHIGYKAGYRGIVWDRYRETASPLVEIISMHGCAESHEAPYPYRHTMGPLNGVNTMQGGLAKGFRFGVIGNSDHHNASPGSYGCGRTGLWATARRRDAIWDALCGKRTCAISGDPIQAILFVDDISGEGVEPASRPCRRLDAYIVGYTSIDRVEIMKNNQVLYRAYPARKPAVTGKSDSIFGRDGSESEIGRIGVELGWGEKQSLCSWDIELSIHGGSIISADPRLRGEDIVDPLDNPGDGTSGSPASSAIGKAFFDFSREGQTVRLTATTRGNPTATTSATQGFSIEAEGLPDTMVELRVKAFFHGHTVDKTWSYSLGELSNVPVSEYIDGFVSPAIALTRFVPSSEYTVEIHHEEERASRSTADWYYLRASQVNGDFVWTSPVWVD